MRVGGIARRVCRGAKRCRVDGRVRREMETTAREIPFASEGACARIESKRVFLDDDRRDLLEMVVQVRVDEMNNLHDRFSLIFPLQKLMSYWQRQ